MDDKTDTLRDIFLDVADEDTVTESQEESHGTLLESDGDDVDERLEEVVDAMRERYDFSTELPVDTLRRIVVAYYDGASDAEMARELDVARETVVRARLDLHLIRDRDTDAPFDLDALRTRLDDGESVGEMASDFDASASTLRRYRRVLRARDRSRRANERYRDAFEEALSDVDLAGRLVDSTHEDGLEDATEDIETDVQF